jgi:hypothetical protein
MKDIYFHDAIKILDFYHLCKRLDTFAKKIHDNNESRYVKRAETLIELFKNSKSKEAVEIIQGLPKRKLAKVNFNFIKYIDNNKENIDYVSGI